MVSVAQLVRASDCGSEGRGFEPHLPPSKAEAQGLSLRFFLLRDCVSLQAVAPRATKIGASAPLLFVVSGH